MKIAAGENVGPIPGEQDFLRPAVGFMWEYALELVAGGMTLEDATEMALKRVLLKQRESVVKQLQVELDDVHGTPDGLDPDPAMDVPLTPLAVDPTWVLVNAAEACLESYKATWRSSRGTDELAGFEDKFWTWHMQEKSYAKMSGLTSCRWIVLFVCGDYSRPIGPRAVECRVDWTQDELDANWEAMMAHAYEMDEEVQA
jgi:hypothetical protein